MQESEEYYKAKLAAIASQLNALGLQRMVEITDFLPGCPIFRAGSGGEIIPMKQARRRLERREYHEER